jgi:hypothetical protein
VAAIQEEATLQPTTIPGPSQMRTSLLRITATTPGLVIRILNSVFFKFLKTFKIFSKFDVILTVHGR